MKGLTKHLHLNFKLNLLIDFAHNCPKQKSKTTKPGLQYNTFFFLHSSQREQHAQFLQSMSRPTWISGFFLSCWWRHSGCLLNLFRPFMSACSEISVAVFKHVPCISLALFFLLNIRFNWCWNTLEQKSRWHCLWTNYIITTVSRKCQFSGCAIPLAASSVLCNCTAYFSFTYFLESRV